MEKRIAIEMNGNTDDRINTKDLQVFLNSIYNKSFSKLVLRYHPSLQQFEFDPEFEDQNVINIKYDKFIDDIYNSKYSEFFNF